LEPENFQVLEGIVRCAEPWTEAQIRWLHQHGIRSMVSLEPLDRELAEAVKLVGMRHLVLDVPDMGLPSAEQIERFLDFMREERASCHPVAIHCALGRGRTGTMYALWLVSTGVEPETAIRVAGTIETDQQKELVREFAAGLWSQTALDCERQAADGV